MPPTTRFVGLTAQIALRHHERRDGASYPVEPANREIAVAARIEAVADTRSQP